jgi:hypothetical protein
MADIKRRTREIGACHHFSSPVSFTPQRDHGIDARGPSRRDEAGHEGDNNKKQRRGAPMPSDNVSSATIVKPGFLIRIRTP